MSNDRRRNSSKVSAYRQPVKLNIGLIIFAFIFIYIVICVISYLAKDHIAIYEVVEKNLSDNTSFTGIALRNEKLVKAKGAGYITFYTTSGTRVAVNDLIFSIDEGGSVMESITNSTKKKEYSDSDYLAIREEIDYYKKKYTNSTFYESYTLKNSLQNLVFELNTGVIYDDLEKQIKKIGEDKLIIDKVGQTGVISYTIDDYYNLTQDKITSSIFDKSGYKYTTNSTGKLLEKNAPAYKIVTNEDWSIVIPLNKEQHEELQNKKRIGVKLSKNNFDTAADITTFKNGDEYFAALSMKGFMANYIDDRFIDIELKIHTASGLKIPNSSIVEKDFYTVPSNVFSKGGNSDSLGLIVTTYDSDGTKKTEFVKTDIYYKKDNTYYIDASLFEAGIKVTLPDSTKDYILSDKAVLKGVYNVNKGYCEFRRIDVLYSNSEYSIVKKGNETDFSLSTYDHIVLDGSQASDQNLIY